MAAAMTPEAETSDALAVQRTLPDDAGGSPQAARRRTARLALTPNAVLSLGLFNSIGSDAAGGFVSVLIGLCDFATFFLCCLPSIDLVERRGEGDIGDAIALDRRKDQIDLRGHRDGGKHLGRNPRQNANTRVSHLNASIVLTSTSTGARSCVVESGSYRRKQRLRTAVRIVTVGAWMPENRGPATPKRGPGSRGPLLVQSSDSHAAIFAALPS